MLIELMPIEEISFETLEEELKQRLDKFLVIKLATLKPEFSRRRIQDLITSGCVFDGEKPITTCDYKIKGTESFNLKIPPAEESEILAKDIPFEIVFEDENMLVINKPAGLTTHPGNGNQQNTLVNALLFYCGKTLSGINGVMRPGIVHRLDKDTSGLMVVAKNDLAHQDLSNQIESRALKRNYLAFCYGTPKPLIGVIDKNLGRSKTNRLKMAIMRDGGRKATTNYKVQKMYFEGKISLIDCKLDTGRTHQIRVHMASLGHSIIGDQTYGTRKLSLGKVDSNIKSFINDFPRQALHSYKISFFHPVSKEEMEFEAGFPADILELQKVCNKFAN
ncbi:MAG: 23S rRNA pseudouridine1911/1915/1917 synthase [Rickettsiales bacterium]|jgi:23S rRNA pseudouridine1911/1915/1917 synthase